MMGISGKFLVIAVLVACPTAVCTGQQRAAVSPDGTILASVQADCTVVLRDVVSGKEVDTLYEPGQECKGIFGGYEAVAQVGPTPWVSFSPDGRLLATDLGGYGRLDIWRVRDRRRVTSLSGAGHISSLEFLLDSKFIVAVGSRGKLSRRNSISLYEIATFRTFLHVSEQGDKSFTKVALSPDGKMVMALVGPKSGSPDRVRIWDIQRPEQPVTLKGRSAWFLPDDNLLLITDSGRPVVWDVKAGKAIR
jgi:WD40 repeat protein